MNSSLFEKYQFKKICSDICFKPSLVLEIAENVDSYYDEWFEVKMDKKTEEPKKYLDGTVKKRVIRPSLKLLKIIQRNIKDNILSKVPLPKCVHGGVKKRSNVTNAKPHQGKKYKLTTDLQDFYPSIKSDLIYDSFLKVGFSNHYSHWLTKLTTWKYELPQGTPTSTHISNIVFLRTDIALIEFCNKHHITYTRYIDDLTFSSPKCFKHLISEILNIIMASKKFKISYRKTKYKGDQTITGIEVFNNYIDAPRKIRVKAFQEITANKPGKPLTSYLNNIRKTNSSKIGTRTK